MQVARLGRSSVPLNCLIEIMLTVCGTRHRGQNEVYSTIVTRRTRILYRVAVVEATVFVGTVPVKRETISNEAIQDR